MKPKVKKKEERRRKRAQVCTETTILLRVTQWYRGEKLEERGGSFTFRVTLVFFLYHSFSTPTAQ